VKFAKPPHGFGVSFEPVAKKRFDEFCEDPYLCRRVIAVINRLMISGHLEGTAVDHDEPGLRVVADRGADTLAVTFIVLGDKVHIRSIQVFE
tara:strand:+ start:28918 stop:29193 length:276 start_codon:yes stop_codon:yes gene_type:complete